MKREHYLIFGLLLLIGTVLIIGSVKEEIQEEEIQEKGGQMPPPCTWVFKTDEDYHNLMYGFLNENRIGFAMYPSPNIKVKPEQLNDGYFAITIGCSSDWAYYFVFCNMTYEEYQTGMDRSILLSSLIEEPFEELYFCNMIHEEELTLEEINELIDNQELDTKCNKII